jgi:hypothetical protein
MHGMNVTMSAIPRSLEVREKRGARRMHELAAVHAQNVRKCIRGSARRTWFCRHLQTQRAHAQIGVSNISSTLCGAAPTCWQ